ncbi:hypothetical protein BN946_scf184942.g21 [Trametes cinnabarina]|uniref:GTP binding protein second domain-containing protein n=1 Tax=Pycnoporus cinnabarinus TaxID=5643 RepID=A0A060S7J4_PYCCI|nr:hypothetical protein BN946_scf184942.g21 [Trametes cinnabarina]
MGIVEKATEYHLGLLKAKLARYRAQLLEPTTKSSGGGTGFDVQKSGDARVALIGFPSVGKVVYAAQQMHAHAIRGRRLRVHNAHGKPPSSFIPQHFPPVILTVDRPSDQAIPGVLEYQGARIQLLDLARNPKTADLILIMLDATKSEEQRRLLEIELDAVGIRLNKKRPDVVFKRKTTGGINKTVPLTKTDEKTIRTILAGCERRYTHKLHNCDVMIREDHSGRKITTDEFIDVLIGTRKYIPCLYVYNKIDAISLERMDQLAREDHTVVISCELGLNLDYLIERIWEELDLVKVYTKKRGAHPDLADPICLRKGATVEGKSSKFNPHAQKVGLNHHVMDEDVVSKSACGAGAGVFSD